MNIFLFIFIFFITIYSSFAKKIIDDEVVLERVKCDDSYCVKLSYVNHFNRKVCIKNTYFPYDGNLNENAFQVKNLDSGEYSKYQLIEPSMVTNSRNAVLVRLIPSGGVVTSTIDLADFYDIEKNQSYRIKYRARAYFCDQYGAENKFILLSGYIVDGSKLTHQ